MKGGGTVLQEEGAVCTKALKRDPALRLFLHLNLSPQIGATGWEVCVILQGFAAPHRTGSSGSSL